MVRPSERIKMAATFSYKEEKMLSEMLWMAITNGNRAVGKAFEPNREQYIMLCDMANRVDEDIKNMQKMYGLD
jgi:hypothetical protein